MFRNILKCASHFSKQNILFNSIKYPLITSKLFQCSQISFNRNIDKWIASLPEDKLKRVRFIQNEIALHQFEMKKVPTFSALTVADFEEILNMSQSRRQKYYKFLFATKAADENDETTKMIRSAVNEERKELQLLTPPTKHLEYGVGKDTLLVKIYPRTVNKWRNIKLMRAIINKEQPIIFDCGFCETMTKFEVRDTARQIKISFSENRLANRPFVMHLCNLEKGSLLWYELRRLMPNIHRLPIKIHSTDVTELFSPEQLVYLSPDSENVMYEFDANDRYILGAIVDKGQQMPLTLAKSKRLKIRSVRLPLEQYIKFHSQKALTLDQMTKILLEIKRSENWNEAFKHVPRRKVH